MGLDTEDAGVEFDPGGGLAFAPWVDDEGDVSATLGQPVCQSHGPGGDATEIETVGQSDQERRASLGRVGHAWR